MKKWLFNASLDNVAAINEVEGRTTPVTGVRKIIDATLGVDGVWMEELFTAHAEAAIDLCIALRYSDGGTQRDTVPNGRALRPFRDIFESPYAKILMEEGRLYVGLGNEVISGAGSVHREQREAWLGIAHSFYSRLAARYPKMRLVSPGLAQGNAALLYEQHKSDARRENFEMLYDILTMANTYDMYLDFHLHNRSGEHVKWDLTLLTAYFAQHFGYEPSIISGEWSMAKMPGQAETTNDALCHAVSEAWAHCETMGNVYALAHTYRSGQDLPDLFKWANLMNADNTAENTQLLDTFVAL